MMITWNNLGVIVPTTEWKLYDIPVVGIELFRVTNFWTIKPYYGMKAYLGQFYGTTDEVIEPVRIYPIKDTKQNIELRIPQALKDAGNITRYIGVRLAEKRRVGIYEYDWQISLDEYISS